MLASLFFAAIGYIYYQTVGIQPSTQMFAFAHVFSMPLSALLLGLFLWRRKPSVDNWISHIGFTFNNILYLCLFLCLNQSILRFVENAMAQTPENFSVAIEQIAVSFGQALLIFFTPRMLFAIAVVQIVCTFLSKRKMRLVRRFN